MLLPHLFTLLTQAKQSLAPSRGELGLAIAILQLGAQAHSSPSFSPVRVASFNSGYAVQR
jgi:hypothetical protein